MAPRRNDDGERESRRILERMTGEIVAERRFLWPRTARDHVAAADADRSGSGSNTGICIGCSLTGGRRHDGLLSCAWPAAGRPA